MATQQSKFSAVAKLLQADCSTREEEKENNFQEQGLAIVKERINKRDTKINNV